MSEHVSQVSTEDAIGFLESACRNWQFVPRLSADDLQDVAKELTRFSYAQTPIEKAAPELLQALKALWVQALQSELNSPNHEYGLKAIALANAAISKVENSS